MVSFFLDAFTWIKVKLNIILIISKQLSKLGHTINTPLTCVKVDTVLVKNLGPQTKIVRLLL